MEPRGLCNGGHASWCRRSRNSIRTILNYSYIWTRCRRGAYIEGDRRQPGRAPGDNFGHIRAKPSAATHQERPITASSPAPESGSHRPAIALSRSGRKCSNKLNFHDSNFRYHLVDSTMVCHGFLRNSDSAFGTSLILPHRIRRRPAGPRVPRVHDAQRT